MPIFLVFKLYKSKIGSEKKKSYIVMIKEFNCFVFNHRISL